MNKYVNVEVAKEYLRHDSFSNPYFRSQACQQAINVLDTVPAADVVEVHHEYWIKQPPDFDLCGVAYYKCSGCGKEQQTPSRYCQFCMAKMDGEQHE